MFFTDFYITVDIQDIRYLYATSPWIAVLMKPKENHVNVLI
jgi:hypothetical protein